MTQLFRHNNIIATICSCHLRCNKLSLIGGRDKINRSSSLFRRRFAGTLSMRRKRESLDAAIS